MDLTLVEHKSSSYGPRTFVNAHAADLTVAIAVDFSTGGEKLTKKAAGENYLHCDFYAEPLVNARLLYRELFRRKAKVLNIAGNGIYTFTKKGVLQQTVDIYLYLMIGQVNKHYPIKKIVSGGQTGVDIAGGIAGCKLGIPVEMTYPKGFRQRHENGIDVDHTEDEIRLQVMNGMARLPTY